MNHASSASNSPELQRLASEYRRKGYEVRLGADIPFPNLKGGRADIIATSSHDSVIVEVITPEEVRQENSRLRLIAREVEKHPGWRLQVASVGAEQPPVAVKIETGALLAEVERLVNQSLAVPAILTGWVVVEAILRDRIAAQAKEPHAKEYPSTSRSLVRTAYILGTISESTMDQLLSLASIHEALAHGSVPTTGVNLQTAAASLLEIAKELDSRKARAGLTSEYEVSELVEWFLSQFEDPANGVPYEGDEGGYQYVLGGPYDPRDELLEQFPDASEELVETAALEIADRGGWEWVRKGQYQTISNT